MGQVLRHKFTKGERLVLILLLYLFNGLSVIEAIVLFAFGAEVLSDLRSKAHVLSGSISFTAFGIVYLLVTTCLLFLHCFLLWTLFRSSDDKVVIERESNGWFNVIIYLLVFSSLVVIPAALIYTYVFIHSTNTGFVGGMYENLRKYGSNGGAARVINELQFQYQCCGANGYEDWLSESNLGVVPFSCCSIKFNRVCDNSRITRTSDPNLLKTINTSGCAQRLQSLINERLSACLVLWYLLCVFQWLIIPTFQYWKSSLFYAINFKGGRDSYGRGYLYIPFTKETEWQSKRSTRSTRSKRSRRSVRRAQPTDINRYPLDDMIAGEEGVTALMAVTDGSDNRKRNVSISKKPKTANPSPQQSMMSGITTPEPKRDEDIDSKRKYKERYYILKEIR